VNTVKDAPRNQKKFQFLSCIVHVFVTTTSSRLQIKYILLTLKMVIVITPMLCKTEPQKKLPWAHFLCLHSQPPPWLLPHDTAALLITVYQFKASLPTLFFAHLPAMKPFSIDISVK
jgi:hypothetical protein